LKYCVLCLVLFLTIGCGSGDSLRLLKQKHSQLNDYLTQTKNELHLCRNNLRTAGDLCEESMRKVKQHLSFCYQEKNYVLGEFNKNEESKRSCVRDNVSLRRNLKRVMSTCNVVCEDCD